MYTHDKLFTTITTKKMCYTIQLKAYYECTNVQRIKRLQNYENITFKVLNDLLKIPTMNNLCYKYICDELCSLLAAVAVGFNQYSLL